MKNYKKNDEYLQGKESSPSGGQWNFQKGRWIQPDTQTKKRQKGRSGSYETGLQANLNKEKKYLSTKRSLRKLKKGGWVVGGVGGGWVVVVFGGGVCCGVGWVVCCVVGGGVGGEASSMLSKNDRNGTQGWIGKIAQSNIKGSFRTLRNQKKRSGCCEIRRTC